MMLHLLIDVCKQCLFAQYLQAVSVCTNMLRCAALSMLCCAASNMSSTSLPPHFPNRTDALPHLALECHHSTCAPLRRDTGKWIQRSNSAY